MKHRLIHLAILAMLAMIAVPATRVSAAGAATKPNLVIILIDDMGYGDIGPFYPRTK